MKVFWWLAIFLLVAFPCLGGEPAKVFENLYIDNRGIDERKARLRF